MKPEDQQITISQMHHTLCKNNTEVWWSDATFDKLNVVGFMDFQAKSIKHTNLHNLVIQTV